MTANFTVFLANSSDTYCWDITVLERYASWLLWFPGR
jgi:hypothetical protein